MITGIVAVEKVSEKGSRVTVGVTVTLGVADMLAIGDGTVDCVCMTVMGCVGLCVQLGVCIPAALTDCVSNGKDSVTVWEAVGTADGVSPEVEVCVAELEYTGEARAQGSHCHEGTRAPLPAAVAGRRADRAERTRSDTGAFAGYIHVTLQPNHAPRAAEAESSAEIVTPKSMEKGKPCEDEAVPAEIPTLIMMGSDTGAHVRWTTELSRLEMLRALAHWVNTLKAPPVPETVPVMIGGVAASRLRATDALAAHVAPPHAEGLYRLAAQLLTVLDTPFAETVSGAHHGEQGAGKRAHCANDIAYVATTTTPTAALPRVGRTCEKAYNATGFALRDARPSGTVP